MRIVSSSSSSSLLSSYRDTMGVGVAESQNAAALKSAYHKLCLRWHPDKNGNSVESSTKFRQVTEAYHALRRAATTRGGDDVLFYEDEEGEDERRERALARRTGEPDAEQQLKTQFESVHRILRDLFHTGGGGGGGVSFADVHQHNCAYAHRDGGGQVPRGAAAAAVVAVTASSLLGSLFAAARDHAFDLAEEKVRQTKKEMRQTKKEMRQTKKEMQQKMEEKKKEEEERQKMEEEEMLQKKEMRQNVEEKKKVEEEED